VGRHQALFYRDSDEYLDGISSFIEPALNAGAPVAIAVPEPNMAHVRGLLGDRVREIRLFDMRKLGRNPGRSISAVQKMIEWHAGQLLRYVGEPIWPGRSPAEIREATRHEALINLAWPDGDVRVLCPYDARQLDDAVLLDAERTHPGIRRSGGVEDSDAFDGASIPSSCEVPLSDPPPEALALAFQAEDLEALRRLVADRAAAAGSLRIARRRSCWRCTSSSPTPSGTQEAAERCASGPSRVSWSARSRTADTSWTGWRAPAAGRGRRGPVDRQSRVRPRGSAHRGGGDDRARAHAGCRGLTGSST
jgi:hypothetical protein